MKTALALLAAALSLVAVAGELRPSEEQRAALIGALLDARADLGHDALDRTCRDAPCWIEVRLDSPDGPRWVLEAPGWPNRKAAVARGRGADGIDYYIAPLKSRRCDPRFPPLCHFAVVLWRTCVAGEAPCLGGRRLLGGIHEGRTIDRIRFLADRPPGGAHEEICPDWPVSCEGWIMWKDLR